MLASSDRLRRDGGVLPGRGGRPSGAVPAAGRLLGALAGLCLATAAAAADSQAASPEPFEGTACLQAEGCRVEVCAGQNGRVNLRPAEGLRLSAILARRWQIGQDSSGRAKCYRLGGGVRVVGSCGDCHFIEDVEASPGEARVAYTLALRSDTASQHEWEIAPVLRQDFCERSGDLGYSFTTRDGRTGGGRLSRIIGNQADVVAFTLRGIRGRDVTLRFGGAGAYLMDRRVESPPCGVWFFLPARDEKGGIPMRQGQVARIDFRVETAPASASRPPSTDDGAGDTCLDRNEAAGKTAAGSQDFRGSRPAAAEPRIGKAAGH